MTQCPECGFVPSPANPADSMGAHKCDGPVRECQHVPQRGHGTMHRYREDKCRCRRCRNASLTARKKVEEERAAGVLSPGSVVDAAPAREHLLRLIGEHRLSVAAVSRETGLDVKTLHSIAKGERGRVLHLTSESILAIDAGRVGTNLVDASDVRAHLRGVQARCAAASAPQIARVSGISLSTVTRVLTGAVHAVTPHVHDSLMRVGPGQFVSDRVEAFASTLRLRALTRAGWSTFQLSEQLPGTSRAVVLTLLLGETASVPEGRHEQVRDLFERLRRRQPPRGTSAQRRSADCIAARAQRKGWPLPAEVPVDALR